MKKKVHFARLARLPLLAALVGTAPMVALAREQRESMMRFAPEALREPPTHLEYRSQLPPERGTVSKEFVRQRLDWLKVEDPRHFKTHVYLETLIDAGYDPVLLNDWLDGLYDDVIVVGMPGDLVLDYYGGPQFQNEVVFEGAPAVEWGLQLRPGRFEKVTVADGKVVRVQG